MSDPAKIQWFWQRLKNAVIKSLRGVFALDDTPYRIAMGCACGIFSSALPIFGQTFIGIILARLLNANVIASIPWSWISNPLTTLPMWYGGYQLGVWLLQYKGKILNHAEIERLMLEFNSQNWMETFSTMSTLLWDALQPLWLGTSVIGIAMAIPGYIAVYYIVRWRQCHRELKPQL